MKKCKGCGAFLQIKDPNLEGYTKTNKELCERCFRIRNYNEYKKVFKDNIEYEKILKEIPESDLVVLIIDLFNIPYNINSITDNLKNDILLVYTKRDVLPLKVSDEKLINYLDIKCIDKLVISSNKNYNFDLLYEKINKYKKTKDVYIVGFTNSGKSTLINKFIYNYSSNNTELTVSNLPSTTLNKLEIEINDNLNLIDTPGIIDEGNIINYVDSKLIKKVLPKKEIKPITYQIHKHAYIYIEDIIKLELSNNNLTFYISNNLNIRKTSKDLFGELVTKEIYVKEGEDLVISGLGFIKVGKSEKIKVSCFKDVLIYTRRGLI